MVRSSTAAGAGANAGRNQQDSPGRRVGGVGAAAAATMSYEVRLGAWNCSCPAFAFEGVGLMGGGSEVWEGVVEERRDRGVGQDEGWVFGGLRNLGCGGGDDEDERKFPVCKHLLACLLVEKCSLFGDGVVIKTVSDEEMAGWAAGWGD